MTFTLNRPPGQTASQELSKLAKQSTDANLSGPSFTVRDPQAFTAQQRKLKSFSIDCRDAKLKGDWFPVTVQEDVTNLSLNLSLKLKLDNGAVKTLA